METTAEYIIRASRAQGTDEWFGHKDKSTPHDAKDVWESSSPIEDRSPIGKYLQDRRLWPLPARMAPLLRQGLYPFKEGKSRKAWVMVARLNRGTDLFAVQLTALEPTGTPILNEIQRKQRLSVGHTQETVWGAPVRNMARLGLAEGVEDAIALALMHKEAEQPMHFWATCGVRTLRQVRIPEGVQDVTIFADHDHNGCESAFDAAARIRGQPWPRPRVSIYMPKTPGHDPWDVYVNKAQFIPAWRVRKRTYPLADFGPEIGTRLFNMMQKMPRDEWGAEITDISVSRSIPKKDLLAAIAAEEAETRFDPERPVLAVHGLRQDIYTRIDEVLPPRCAVFSQGEGGQGRVVVVEEISETRRRELAEQDVKVTAGQPVIAPVNFHMLADRIEQQFFVYKETDEGPCQCDLPLPVARGWLESGRWSILPSIRGLAPYPVLRLDGSLAQSQGYDVRSGFWLTYDGPHLQLVEEPTEDHARAAVAKFLDKKNGLLRSYPFEEEHHRLGALAFLLQLLDRHNMRLAPAWVFDAPMPRTGKMHLMRACSLVALGMAPVIYAMSDNREERHKRVTHLLLDGSPLVCADNINDAFDSSDVATYLGEGRALVRPYGMTGGSLLALNSNTLAFTGNNMSMTNDMQTRCAKVRLDARMGNPEERHFTFNAHDADRGEYLMAALTILRWAAQQEPRDENLKGLGAFVDWDNRIRQPLYALTGIDVAKCFDDMKADDPFLGVLGEQLQALESLMGVEPFTAADVRTKVVDWSGARQPNDMAILARLPFPVTAESAVIGRVLNGLAGKRGGGMVLVVRAKRSRTSQAKYQVTRDDAGNNT